LRIKELHFKRFDNGELMKSLKDFIELKKIKAGSIFCLGFLSKPVLGFFNWKKNNYKKININKEVEIVSCYGNLARKKENDQLIIHLHGVVADNNGKTYGGHFFKAQIKLVEAMIFETDKLTRSLDKNTKLYYMDA